MFADQHPPPLPPPVAKCMEAEVHRVSDLFSFWGMGVVGGGVGQWRSGEVGRIISSMPVILSSEVNVLH